MLTGAVPANLSFGSFDSLADASATSSGFLFTTPLHEPLVFRLEFEGAADAGSHAVYILSAGTYPLTLTLLEDGQAYGTFTAREGTVNLSEDGGRAAALLTDDRGRQLFLSARFRRPDV